MKTSDSWQRGGVAPKSGYYWLVWSVDIVGRRQSLPAVLWYKKGYVFSDTTAWIYITTPEEPKT